VLVEEVVDANRFRWCAGVCAAEGACCWPTAASEHVLQMGDGGAGVRNPTERWMGPGDGPHPIRRTPD